MNNPKTDLYVDPSVALCNKTKTDKELSPFFAVGYHDCHYKSGSYRKYYIYCPNDDRVHAIKQSQFNRSNLLKIAGIDYWRTHYGTTDNRYKDGINWGQAEIELISACTDIGQFQGAARPDNNNIKGASHDS